MTALDRARGWFVAPPDAAGQAPPWCALETPAPAGPVEDPGPADAGAPAHREWRPPASGIPADDAASPPAAVRRPQDVDARATERIAGSRAVTSAAVLGRTGEAEPVAAALALALRQQTRAATATVGLVGAALGEHAGGGRPARRLRERLDAHGFEVRVRGRLAWVRLKAGEGHLAAAARRLALVGAPAVLAVCAPRDSETDEALLDCDLVVVVAADPSGPLTSLAGAGLDGAPVVSVRPLARGPARALARAGFRPPRSVRQLLATEQEQP